jgi:hypothetical protein
MSTENYVAYIDIDWADRKHDIALPVLGKSPSAEFYGVVGKTIPLTTKRNI